FLPAPAGDKRGTVPFHNPHDPLVRKFTLEAARYGQASLPLAPDEVVANMAQFVVDYLNPIGYPDTTLPPVQLVKWLEDGTLKPKTQNPKPPMYKNGHNCIEHAYLFT